MSDLEPAKATPLGPYGIVAAASRAAIRAAGTALRDRWPLYGPAVARLGVEAVIAAPLRLPASSLGALCAYDVEPVIREDVAASVDRMAETLTHMVLLAPWPAPSAGDLPSTPLSEEADFQAVVHQAAGIVSVLCECGVDDAEEMLRARAFADGKPLEQVALGVVRGETRLC